MRRCRKPPCSGAHTNLRNDTKETKEENPQLLEEIQEEVPETILGVGEAEAV